MRIIQILSRLADGVSNCLMMDTRRSMFSAWIADDERRSIRDDVARLALEPVEHRIGKFSGIQVGHAHQLGDVAFVVGYALIGAHEGQRS